MGRFLTDFKKFLILSMGHHLSSIFLWGIIFLVVGKFLTHFKKFLSMGKHSTIFSRGKVSDSKKFLTNGTRDTGHLWNDFIDYFP